MASELEVDARNDNSRLSLIRGNSKQNKRANEYVKMVQGSNK
jgi:hypothetical protein